MIIIILFIIIILLTYKYNKIEGLNAHPNIYPDIYRLARKRIPTREKLLETIKKIHLSDPSITSVSLYKYGKQYVLLVSLNRYEPKKVYDLDGNYIGFISDTLHYDGAYGLLPEWNRYGNYIHTLYPVSMTHNQLNYF